MNARDIKALRWDGKGRRYSLGDCLYLSLRKYSWHRIGLFEVITMAEVTKRITGYTNVPCKRTVTDDEMKMIWS